MQTESNLLSLLIKTHILGFMTRGLETRDYTSYLHNLFGEAASGTKSELERLKASPPTVAERFKVNDSTIFLLVTETLSLK